MFRRQMLEDDRSEWPETKTEIWVRNDSIRCLMLRWNKWIYIIVILTCRWFYIRMNIEFIQMLWDRLSVLCIIQLWTVRYRLSSLILRLRLWLRLRLRLRLWGRSSLWACYHIISAKFLIRHWSLLVRTSVLNEIYLYIGYPLSFLKEYEGMK